MVIIETSVFTRQVQQLMPDEEYRELQKVLASYPALGALIPDGGGLRKLRWSGQGHGKRGGLRVIYYWVVSQEQILMLFLYAKNVQTDLSETQLKVLRKIIKEEYP